MVTFLVSTVKFSSNISRMGNQKVLVVRMVSVFFFWKNRFCFVRYRIFTEKAETDCSPSLLLILKWGGELTAHGRAQAEDLGKAFRKLYPGENAYTKDENKSATGFLRLHSTYRHDLKIYASDEGRVQMTGKTFEINPMEPER